MTLRSLSRIRRARHCIRSHSAAPARPPQTMPRWPATVCRVPLPHTIRTRRRRAASPVWLEELTLPTATPPSRHVRSVRALAAAGSKGPRAEAAITQTSCSEANTRLRIAIRQCPVPRVGIVFRVEEGRPATTINLIVGRRFLIDLLRSPPVIIRRPHPFKQCKAAARELARWIIVFPAAFRRFVSPAACSWPPPSAQSQRRRRAAALDAARQDRPRR